MYLFFEEDGNFKAGSVMKKDGSVYQVELPSGKRTKVKGGHVFFEFEGVSAIDFMAKADRVASELDPQFLWEVAAGEEISYEAIAKEYFGLPKPEETAATLLVLHRNPVYFYRKGRGQYKPAPADILERALQTLAKREAEELRRKQMVEEMTQGKLPEEISEKILTLLIKPDKNSIEWKALNDASSATRMTPIRLALSLGAPSSAFRWHVDGFYFEHFPHGKKFPKNLVLPESHATDLPVAQVQAFSIDDSATTEIDDASSVTWLDNGRIRIGIHIAAPSLLIPRDSDVDKVARERMSTVYAPGIKTTMLPEEWINAASLTQGKSQPCVSLYVTVDESTMGIVSTETRLERVTVKDNLRYDKFESDVTEEAIVNGTLDIPYAREIGVLWRFSKARLTEREAFRGKPEPPNRVEWYFVLDGDDEHAKIQLKSRTRGAPIDLLVSETMIFANSTWGLWLEEHGVCGIYRNQHMGRVKMSTIPGPHDGLGVLRYAWSTSPLRRYVDMVNQRQLVSALMGVTPAYLPNDTDLFTCISSFEVLYEAYNDFQRKMERYWSLRWIEQEGLKEVVAQVVKDDLVRIDGLPLSQRIPGLPILERGRRIRLQVIRCDFIDIVLETRLLEVLDETGNVEEEPEALESEVSQSEKKEAFGGTTQGSNE